MSDGVETHAEAAFRSTVSMKPIERTMPYISFIVARSSPGDVIGCENQLPWRIKTDMRFFRKVTDGHVVIMGRKTFESIGKPLPNRVNIILSAKAGEEASDLRWASTPETALYLADVYSILNDKSEIIVIGGSQIYGLFAKQFTKVYLTEVFHDFKNGDAYFREEFDQRKWKVLESIDYTMSEHDEYDFRISVLVRKNEFVRHRNIEEFYVGNNNKNLSKILPRVQEKLNTQSLEISPRQALLPLLVA